MELVYLELALIINQKLYDKCLITSELYDDVNQEIRKKMRFDGFI